MQACTNPLTLKPQVKINAIIHAVNVILRSAMPRSHSFKPTENNLMRLYKNSVFEKNSLNNLFPYYNIRANDNNGLAQQVEQLAAPRCYAPFVLIHYTLLLFQVR
ncbi:MAG: hypothetical protein ACI9Y1_001158 [Lentisphaeria bacterium]|jgi:hypothetical protein